MLSLRRPDNPDPGPPPPKTVIGRYFKEDELRLEFTAPGMEGKSYYYTLIDFCDVPTMSSRYGFTPSHHLENMYVMLESQNGLVGYIRDDVWVTCRIFKKGEDGYEEPQDT